MINTVFHPYCETCNHLNVVVEERWNFVDPSEKTVTCEMYNVCAEIEKHVREQIGKERGDE